MAASAGVIAALLFGTVHAQFGIVNLPKEDFVWRWGEIDEARRRGFEDFRARGSEGSFFCELTGSLRGGARMSRSEVRQMENDLQTSLYFIQSVAYTMNSLDRSFDLDWAELACAKPDPKDEDPQEVQERVDKAREKAVQEMLRRREQRERKAAQ